jgi:hypothetical protein
MVVKRCARLRRQDIFVKGRDDSVVFVECANGREESEEGSDLNLSMGSESARLGWRSRRVRYLAFDSRVKSTTTGQKRPAVLHRVRPDNTDRQNDSWRRPNGLCL